MRCLLPGCGSVALPGLTRCAAHDEEMLRCAGKGVPTKLYAVARDGTLQTSLHGGPFMFADEASALASAKIEATWVGRPTYVVAIPCEVTEVQPYEKKKE